LVIIVVGFPVCQKSSHLVDVLKCEFVRLNRRDAKQTEYKMKGGGING